MRWWLLLLLFLVVNAVPETARAQAPDAVPSETEAISTLTRLHLVVVQEVRLDDGRVLRMEIGSSEPLPGFFFRPGEGRRLSADLFLLTKADKARQRVLDSVSLELPWGEGMVEAQPLDRAMLTLSERVHAVPVTVGLYSDGEGSEELSHYVLVGRAKLQPVLSFRDTPNSGSGYPYTRSSTQVRTLASTSHWLADLEVTRVSADAADAEQEVEHSEDVSVYRWDGKKYELGSPTADSPQVASVKASSVLKEQGLPANFYAEELAVDGLTETAWVEGVKGPGLGESLEVLLEKPVMLEGVELNGSCGLTPERRMMNHRLKKVRLTFSEGTPVVLELHDSSEAQMLTLPKPRTTSSLKVTILEVYRGSRYDDACISELDLAQVPLGDLHQ